MTSRRTDAQPPQKFTGLKVSSPKSSSTGLNAVASAIKHALLYMNPWSAARSSLNVNQKNGFDCPGCAWPDPDDDRSIFAEYCENGMKAIAEEATRRRIGAEFFAQHDVPSLATWSDFELGKQGRIAEPLVLEEGCSQYRRIGWDQAFQLIATELNALASPDDAIFYTSGRTSNEAAFLYQLFVREFGTNNLPDCSNLCHESSGKALTQTLGIGKGSVKLSDLYEAQVIVVIGQNPGTNHPRMLAALEKCKENGGRIIAINPLREAGLLNFVHPQRPGKIISGGTQLADLYLQVKPNADVPLLKALMLCLLEAEQQRPGDVLDQEFIHSRTAGYDAFVADLKRYSTEDLAQLCGVPLPEIQQAANLLAHQRKIIVCWAMGLTQHENAVDNIREIVNLLLLKGSIGKPGAGTCPVRGHSNVQGDRTVGIWEAPPEEFLDSLQRNFGFQPPRKHGYAVVDAIEAMANQPGKVFIAMGGNFLSASPDTELTARALKNCALTVHVSTKLNRSHLIHGKQALILPCLGRTDVDQQDSGKQFVSVENSMGVVHRSQGVLTPCSPKLKSETAIVAGIAQATLGPRSKIDWAHMISSYDHIRSAIESTIPGFEDYNHRVRQPGGFYLPNGVRDGRFNTPDGKAHFTINQPASTVLADDEFLMITNRSHDQFNTTIYGLNDRYRGIRNERRVVFVNRNDMLRHGLKDRQVVDLESHFRGETRRVHRFIVVAYDLPEQCVMTYFPEANALVPLKQQAHTSKTPASKSVVVKIVPLEQQPESCI